MLARNEVYATKLLDNWVVYYFYIQVLLRAKLLASIYQEDASNTISWASNLELQHYRHFGAC